MADGGASSYNVDLNPGTQGSSELGRSRQQRIERTRRSWSLREEEILLVTLRDLVSHGWKSDNGFRAGYLNKIEEAIRREFPYRDLKMNPHIVSKISSWKKNYYSLQGILNRSGIGFNLRGDYMVDCDQDSWDQIIKVDPHARAIRYKSWPYWDAWKEIFGKDRANGSNAEDVMEAANELYLTKKGGVHVRTREMHTGLDDFSGHDIGAESVPTDAAEDSVCQGLKDSQPPRCKGKKRKEDEGVTKMIELLSRMHEDTSARLQCLAERIGYYVDISKARNEVFHILGKIHRLSLDEKFDVCETLVKESERLDLFMGLPVDARPAYVFRILRGKNAKVV